jgi:hypothetical protein
VSGSPRCMGAIDPSEVDLVRNSRPRFITVRTCLYRRNVENAVGSPLIAKFSNPRDSRLRLLNLVDFLAKQAQRETQTAGNGLWVALRSNPILVPATNACFNTPTKNVSEERSASPSCVAHLCCFWTSQTRPNPHQPTSNKLDPVHG